MRGRIVAPALALLVSVACGRPPAGGSRTDRAAVSAPLSTERGLPRPTTATTVAPPKPSLPTPTSTPKPPTPTSTSTTAARDPVRTCQQTSVRSDGFTDGSSLLTVDMRHQLRALAADARALDYVTIDVVGYTDARPIDGGNEALAEARADEARRELMDAGIEADRITAHGAGVAPGSDLHDPSTWPAARRVEVTIRC